MDKVGFLLSLLVGGFLMETNFVLTSPPTTSETNETDQGRYTPGYLLSLGQSLNSPLLKLIGLTLCNLNPCSDWSKWSECSEGSLGFFGNRNRTRMCGQKDGGCRGDSKNTVEEETERSLCEGFCPSDYNLTQHGFCLKYVPVGMNHSTAIGRCQEHGGRVVNMNSNNKLDDIRSTFKTSSFWVDGTRTNSASPWIYTYDESPASMNWAGGEPDNSATELCVAYGTDIKRHDVPCKGGYHVVCEKVGPESVTVD